VAATRHTIRDGDRDMLVAYVLPTLDEIAASDPENEDDYVRPLLHNSAVLLKSLGLPAVPFHKYRAADKVQRFVGRKWLGDPICRKAHLRLCVLYPKSGRIFISTIENSFCGSFIMRHPHPCS
jgi:hypothetical protein